MKRLFGIALLAFCFSGLNAQTVSYTIDTISQDSFFLIETAKSAVSPESPRPSISQTSQLFRSYTDVIGFIDYLRKQAQDADTKAKEAEKTALEQRALQQRIEQSAKQIEAAIKASKPFFDSPKLATSPPKK